MPQPTFTLLFELRPSPTGGGNQFLKALKNTLATCGHYDEDAAKANIVLFNSHNEFERVFEARRQFPNKIFIHRVDGPMRLYHEANDPRDSKVIKANRFFADATVFQSEWTKAANLELGWQQGRFDTVIGNAPDGAIFNTQGRRRGLQGGKVRLLATSWSHNRNKGFDVYEYLDSSLDFSRYEMTFIGNSPCAFRNIRHMEPRPSEQVAEELKRCDIFITASRNDPCSNSLIEALHCGLPAVVLRDGGHPEIIKGAGECFTAPEEIPALLQRIEDDYEGYVSRIDVPSISDIAGRYIDFAGKLLEELKQGNLHPKRMGLLARILFAVQG